MLNRTSLAAVTSRRAPTKAEAVTHLPLPSRPLTAGGQWRVGGNGDVRLPLISFPLTSATQDGKSHVQDGTTFWLLSAGGTGPAQHVFLFSPVNGAVGKTISSSSSSPSILREQDIKKNRVVDADLNTYHVYVHVTIQPWFCFVTWQQLHDEFFFLDSDPQLMETTHDTPLI